MSKQTKSEQFKKRVKFENKFWQGTKQMHTHKKKKQLKNKKKTKKKTV